MLMIAWKTRVPWRGWSPGWYTARRVREQDGKGHWDSWDPFQPGWSTHCAPNTTSRARVGGSVSKALGPEPGLGRLQPKGSQKSPCSSHSRPWESQQLLPTPQLFLPLNIEHSEDNEGCQPAPCSLAPLPPLRNRLWHGSPVPGRRRALERKLHPCRMCGTQRSPFPRGLLPEGRWGP